MSATTPAEADGPATIPELDDDALLAIFMHLPAPSLMTAMACSRGWRNIVRHSDVLWLQKLFEDFPMYDRIPMSSPLPDVLASNRRTHPGWAKASAMGYPGWATASAMGYSSVYFTAYDCIVRGMCEATCELLNPNLCEGKFASAFLCKVKFDREVGALRLHGDSPGLRTPPGLRDDTVLRAAVLGSRLRKASGGYAEFATPMPSFTALREGEVVELQWKKSAHSAQFAWWFAIVGRVVSADVVELVFPQYGTSAKSALTHASAIHRTRGTEMHGGLAGGVRKVGAAEVAQWWMALASEDYDRVLKQEQSWDCTAARAARAARAAAAATATLEPQPLEPVTRSTWQYVSDLVCIREVFTRHLPKGAIRRSMEIAGASTAEVDRLEQRIEASREERRGTIRGPSGAGYYGSASCRRPRQGSSFVDYPLLDAMRLGPSSALRDD
jgi:hypothetical protein